MLGYRTSYKHRDTDTDAKFPILVNPKTPENPRTYFNPATAMAKADTPLEKFKQAWISQIEDEDKWAANAKLLRALAIFGGAVFVMRNFGDMMAV